MQILEPVKVIVPIILIALIGYVFGRFKKTDLKTLANYIIYIGSPALALTQLSMMKMDLREISLIALSAVLVILGSGLIVYLLSRAISIPFPTGLYLPVMFMNSGFIGYPLAFFALGTAGLSKAIVYDITNAILIFTLGIYLLSRGKDRWQVLKIPFIYAALIGLALSLSGARMPQFIFSPLYLLGGTTIPLALFMLGSRLADMKIAAIRLPLIASLLRLGLGLGLGYLAILVLRLGGITANVVILSSSLPAAVTTVALAEEYESDPELVASTIALSTLLSIVTILLVLNWMMVP
jgi:hypothetical protein